MDLKDFRNEIIKKIDEYRNVIGHLGFALPEAEQLRKNPKRWKKFLRLLISLLHLVKS